MKNEVSAKDVQLGFTAAYTAELAYLEKTWEALTNSQIELLFRVISPGKVYKNDIKLNVARTLKALIAKGILRKQERGKYLFTDPFFKRFVELNE